MKQTTQTVKKVGLACMLIMALVGLTLSCGKDEAANGGASGSASSSGSSASNKKQSFSFITWRGDDSAAYDKIIAAFNEKYPNITVNIEYLKGGTTYDGIVTTRGMGGELDLYAAQPGGQLAAYVYSDFALDLSDQPFVDRVIPGAKAAGTYDGKTYGVAQATSTNCVFYNKEIFAEYNLEIPTTWDEFIAICDTLQSNGVTPLVVGYSQNYMAQNLYKMMTAHWMPEDSPSFWQAITLGEKTLADEPFPTVMKDIESLYHAGYYIDGVEGIDKHGAASLFAQGKVAMDIEGTWRASTIADIESCPEFGIFGLPYKGDPAQPVHVVAPNQTHLIFPGSKNIDAALTFYDFMMTPEMMEIYANETGSVPTVVGTPVASETTNMILDFLNSTTGVLGPNIANTSNEVQQEIYNAYTMVAVGMDTDEVIAEMQAKIDNIER